jgi:hypothetical protein
MLRRLSLKLVIHHECVISDALNLLKQKQRTILTPGLLVHEQLDIEVAFEYPIILTTVYGLSNECCLTIMYFAISKVWFCLIFQVILLYIRQSAAHYLCLCKSLLLPEAMFESCPWRTFYHCVFW